MAWTDPGDFTSGQILTAGEMDNIREAMFFGQATFTNEAARDAAIPATGITLQEGMRAYLTAPTVPAATGGSTAVPTGITTIYNGSAWVCVTEVAAYTDTTGTTTSTTFTNTLTSGGTNPSVTLSTGTTALVMANVVAQTSGTATLNIGVNVTGATTVSADASAVAYAQANANYQGTLSIIMVFTGLTAGSNTFSLAYLTSAGTGSFLNRRLVVKGIA